MRLGTDPRNGRFLAIVLLLIAVLLGYLLLVHWWFVAPALDISAQMQDLREQQQRARRQRGAQRAARTCACSRDIHGAR